MKEKKDYHNHSVYVSNEANFSVKPYVGYGEDTASWIEAQKILGNNDLKLKDIEKKFDSFYKNRKEVLDLSFVESFLKPVFNGKLSNYFVKKQFGFGWFGNNKKGKTFSDGFWKYVLGSGEEYCAVLSFETLKDSILVTQMQGFGNLSLLKPIRSSDLLLAIVEEDMRNLPIKEINILPYFRSRWPLVRQNFQNTYKRKYDQPAKRRGYFYDSEKGVWVKKLE